MELCLMYDNRSMIRVTWCCTKTSVPKFCPLAKNKRIEIIFSFYRSAFFSTSSAKLDKS
jgi:hypothetical protein